MNTKEFIWEQKYRPNRVEDVILPLRIKKSFLSFLEQENVPNLLLFGPSGTGKTTVARALLEELGSDYTIINGSLNANIDALRNDIASFVSSKSLYGTGRKYVILDEADGLSPSIVQPALRNFFDTFSSNAGFILTCNYPNKIIKEIHSRCAVIDFTYTKKEKSELSLMFYERVVEILKHEKVEYEEKIIGQFILKYFPDCRRILNELQRYSNNGKIDVGILVPFVDANINLLIKHLKEKNFYEIRKWVGENTDIPFSDLSKYFYTNCSSLVKENSIPMMVLILSKYLYQSSFVVDPDINTSACLAELMTEMEWK